MGGRLAAIAVGTLLILGALIVVAPKAAADWCSSSYLSYSPTSGTEGSSVTFFFDFDNEADTTIQVSSFTASFSWGGFSDFGPHVVAPYGAISGTTTEVLPSTTGVQSVTAQVTGQGNTDYYPIACYFGPFAFYVVAPTRLTATIAASPAATDVGMTVHFTAGASGGTSPYTYAWDFGDGTTGSGATDAHAYTHPGNYTAVVTVHDSSGTSASASRAVQVGDPTARASASTTAATSGVAVTFTASGAGGGGPPYTFAWSFGDGATAKGATASHVYASQGMYTPTVTVTDTLGGTNVTTLPSIAVQAPGILGAITSPRALPLLVVGIVAAAGAVAAAAFLLQRRKKSKAPPPPPPAS